MGVPEGVGGNKGRRGERQTASDMVSQSEWIMLAVWIIIWQRSSWRKMTIILV